MTGYGLEGRGLIPGNGKEFSLYRVETGSGGYPASCPIGNESSSSGGKAPGREADR
jgi:hypothetical protein